MSSKRNTYIREEENMFKMPRMTKAERQAREADTRGVLIAIAITIVGIVVMFAAVLAEAGEAQIACTPPTTHTDGTAITRPITYTFHWGTSATTLTNTQASSTCAATITVPDPAPGASITYHFAVRAIVDGQQSALTNTVSKTITRPAPTPNPPSGLRVLEPTAYREDNGNKGKVAHVAIGTVPMGTTCDGNYESRVYGLSLNQVDRDTVTLNAGQSRPLQVWAKCG